MLSSQNATSYMSTFANNALLGGGVRVTVEIRDQRKIKGTAKLLVTSLKTCLPTLCPTTTVQASLT